MSQLPPANVPTIDVSPLFRDDPDAKKKAATQIDQACRGSSFFYAANHGVDVHKLSAVTKKFHMSITDEEKWKLAIRAYNKDNAKQICNGYCFPIKGKKAVESFCILNPGFKEDHPMIKANTLLHEVNVWPDEDKHLGFKEYQESYFWSMCDLYSALLRGFALKLGKTDHFFDEYFKKEDILSSVALIRYPYLEDYPPVTGSDGTKLSFDRHENVSLITIFYQSRVKNLRVEMIEGYRDISYQCWNLYGAHHW
jgi:isopenicillin-N synthase